MTHLAIPPEVLGSTSLIHADSRLGIFQYFARKFHSDAVNLAKSIETYNLGLGLAIPAIMTPEVCVRIQEHGHYLTFNETWEIRELLFRMRYPESAREGL